MLCDQEDKVTPNDWLYVLRTHADIIFNWLVRKDDTVLPVKLPVNGIEAMYHGADVLRLALTCIDIFLDYLPLIERRLIFRSQYDAKYQFYSPTKLTVLDQTATLNIPFSSTHLFIDPKVILTHVPASVTHIIAGDVNSLNFPPHLTHLTCTDSSQKFFEKVLPPTLKYLKFDGPRLPPLPPSLSYLDVTSCSEFPPFPLSLTHLILRKITHPLPPFPPSLSRLESYYCQIKLPDLPLSLIHFKLVNEFIHKDIPTLPPSLQDLIVDSNYLQNINFPTLPPSLKSLTFPMKYKQLVHELPSLLTHLTHGYLSLDQPLPVTLRYLELPKDFADPLPPLPPLITHLIFPLRYNHPIPTLPSTLTHLQAGFSPSPLQHLPFLTHLTIKQDDSTRPIRIHSFPPSVTHLTLDIKDDECVYIPPLPSSLIYLFHNGKAALPRLPDSLLYLMCPSYGYPIPSLPSNLLHLSMGTKYKYPLPPLPHTLERLELQAFRANCPFPQLPQNLQFLSLPLEMAPPPSCGDPSPFSSNLLWLECGESWYKEWNVASLLPDKCHVKLYVSLY